MNVTDYDSYEARQVARVLNAGPMNGEDWFRLQVIGREQTKQLDITPDQLAQIAALLEEWNA